jgi:hypothetical protein
MTFALFTLSTFDLDTFISELDKLLRVCFLLDAQEVKVAIISKPIKSVFIAPPLIEHLEVEQPQILLGSNS